VIENVLADCPPFTGLMSAEHEPTRVASDPGGAS
jgi:hypothetical protein